MSQSIVKISGSDYREYLRDESRSAGHAESISFPENEDEIRQVLSAIVKQGLPLTVQGARTGLTGAAVPQGGHIMNLGKMNRITGARYDSTKNRGNVRLKKIFDSNGILNTGNLFSANY